MDEDRKKKIEAFLNEIETIYNKYQLRLLPYIEHDTLGNMNARFTVKDQLPKPAEPADTTIPQPPIDNVEEKPVS